MELITPRVHMAFKKLFGVEGNEDLLISLINSVVGEEDQVKEVTLLNPYNFKNFNYDELSILDITAKGDDGKRFNIEIKIIDTADYDKKALHYWANLYTEKLKVTEDYSVLSKAIGIHILNFTSILGVEQYHNVFHISEKRTGFLYFKNLELHTIELDKFYKDVRLELADIVAKVRNPLDMWVAFLTHYDLLDNNNLPVSMNSPALKKALDVIEVMGFRVHERQVYDNCLKWLRILSSTLRKRKRQGVEKGEKRGIKKGEKIGIEKGEKIGVEKGEKIGIEKGEKIGVEKGEKIGIKKGEKIGIEKGEKIGIEKGEKIGIKKGEKIGIEKGEKVGREKSKEEVAIAMLIDGMVVTKVAMLTKLSIEQVAALADTITHKK